MNNEQLMAKRTELLEMLAQFTFETLNLEEQMANLKSRMKHSVQDLVAVTNELNRLAQEAAKEEAENVSELKGAE